MVSRQQGVKDLTKAERSTIDAMRRVRQRVGKKVIKIGLGSISKAMNRSKSAVKKYTSRNDLSRFGEAFAFGLVALFESVDIVYLQRTCRAL